MTLAFQSHDNQQIVSKKLTSCLSLALLSNNSSSNVTLLVPTVLGSYQYRLLHKMKYKDQPGTTGHFNSAALCDFKISFFAFVVVGGGGRGS